MFEDIPVLKPKVNDVPRLYKFAPLTSQEVNKLIIAMKTKTSELDIIPTRVLKDILPSCLDAITKIVNLSLEYGVFASDWKMAVVRPLLKKVGLDLIYKNFRPVSNLSFISKLVEKAVLNQFIDHLNKFDLMPEHQSAYRQGHSCETAVIKLCNDILWNMEAQMVTGCVFMDLSAAFDTVDHELMLDILEKTYGISSVALGWYNSYLHPRAFKVCVNSTYSDSKNLTFSVPQGSASGANLFTAYCASIIEAIPSDITLQGFADDHFVYKGFKPNIEENVTISQLEQTMINVKTWMDKMRLKMNTNKTEMILFGHHQQLSKCTINKFTAGEDEVPISGVVRCLGSWLDKTLTFKHHVNQKVKTASWNLLKIRNIRKYLTKDACETLVVGLVLSHIDYCNSILIDVPEVTLKPFKRLLAASAKLILNKSKFTSTSEALSTLHWLPLESRIKYKIITIMHKISYGVAPVYLAKLVTLRSSSMRTLRSTSEVFYYHEPWVKHKTFAFRSFSVQGPRLWNMLPSTIKSIGNYDTFKKHLKAHLFSKIL